MFIDSCAIHFRLVVNEVPAIAKWPLNIYWKMIHGPKRLRTPHTQSHSVEQLSWPSFNCKLCATQQKGMHGFQSHNTWKILIFIKTICVWFLITIIFSILEIEVACRRHDRIFVNKLINEVPSRTTTESEIEEPVPSITGCDPWLVWLNIQEFNTAAHFNAFLWLSSFLTHLKALKRYSNNHSHTG